MTLTLKP